MNKLYAELKSISLIILVVFVFRSCFINWYVVPSGSLLPTIKLGDHVVVNKLSYGFMLPFMETQIFSWAHPQRGDIVVFRGPESANEVNLIKRVVGLPGDRVSFTNGILTVNGVLAQEKLITDRSPLELAGGNEVVEDKDLFLESGFSKEPHYILRKKWGGRTEVDTKTYVVPEHKLLLVGDNRDNSTDGRYWGFMDENRLYGRAFMISYSTYEDPNSWWPFKFRTDRWFSKITN